MRINQPSEILVFCQEDPFIRKRQVYHPHIISPRPYLSDFHHIVAALEQRLCQRNITALIDNETQGNISQEAFLETITVSSWAIMSAAKRMAA